MRCQGRSAGVVEKAGGEAAAMSTLMSVLHCTSNCSVFCAVPWLEAQKVSMYKLFLLHPHLLLLLLPCYNYRSGDRADLGGRQCSGATLPRQLHGQLHCCFWHPEHDRQTCCAV